MTTPDTLKKKLEFRILHIGKTDNDVSWTTSHESRINLEQFPIKTSSIYPAFESFFLNYLRVKKVIRELNDKWIGNMFILGKIGL